MTGPWGLGINLGALSFVLALLTVGAAVFLLVLAFVRSYRRHHRHDDLHQ